MKKILIVGAVGGGATVAGQIRFYDKNAEIKVFDRDAVMSYAACGTPYAIGNIIEDEEKLLMTDPEKFKQKRNIDVYLKHEVLSIDRSGKSITVLNLETGEEFIETYDALILSPGGSAIMPEIPGIETASVFTLRNFDDMQTIKNYIKKEQPKNCAVSGAGFIGIEMAENLKRLGIDVQIVHRSPTVMSILDEDISREIEKELKDNGVSLYTETVINEISGRLLKLSNGSRLDADFIIMSIGLKPNIELAQKAGLPIGETLGIITNEFMQTADPAIYAIGDAAENTDFVTGAPKRVPLASPAHRQAFLVAQHLAGNPVAKKGLLGTSIVKIFNLTAAMTGLNEKTLKGQNFPYATIVHRGNSNAGYYPDHFELVLKIHYNTETRKILGAQCIGGKGVDKRIDVIVTAMFGDLTVDNLQELELCYAPPYSSPKDAINMAGYKSVNN